jgi:hypothetical protein
MRVLLIGEDDTEINNPYSIRNWHSFCVFFLNKVLKKNNIEVIYKAFNNWERRVNPIDCVKDINEIGKKVDFVLGVRRIERLLANHGDRLIKALNSISNSKLCSYGDLVISHKSKYNEKIFTVLLEDNIRKNIYKVWWCGDKEYLYPEQNTTGNINILLDHIDYSPLRKSNNDIFHVYRQGLDELSKKYPIDVKIIADPSVVDFDLEKEKEYSFGRGRNRWIDMISHYRQTHIYCVTHKESGGLTVMETGCCGASIVIPNDFINPILRSEVNSYYCRAEKDSIQDAIEKAILEFDLKKNLEIANRYTWDDTLKKILAVMA